MKDVIPAQRPRGPCAPRPILARPSSLLPASAKDSFPASNRNSPGVAQTGRGHRFGQLATHDTTPAQSRPSTQPIPSSDTGSRGFPVGGAGHVCPVQVQTKLRVGRADDPLEHEADQVADQVMRMPNPWNAGTVQREISQKEIEQQLVKAYTGDAENLQREVAEPEDKDAASVGEESLMQSESAGTAAPPRAGLEAAVHSLEGGGQPLSPTVREFMEPRFGHDFGNVRVHATSRAAEMAAMANARAFTVGRNVVFAPGEYVPDGSPAGRRLLAHELAHVIQQGRAGPRLQRQIVVDGKPFTPTPRYLDVVLSSFGPAMKEFAENMHNGGKPPVFSFSSFAQMTNEMRIRSYAIKGIEEVHKGCCNYFDNAHPPHLDSTYWDQVGSAVHFRMKSTLPAGKHPSDAIDAIFAPGAGTRLECLSMTLAIEYYSMLKGLGPDKFNAQFAAGIEISASPSHPLIVGADRKYDIVGVGSKAEILPGDWVYFKNFHDYTTRVPGGYWQGENAIALGGGRFRGFGVAPLSEHDLNQELVNQYNNGAVPHLSKTVADLIADGGGLLLNPVVRPISSKIAH